MNKNIKIEVGGIKKRTYCFCCGLKTKSSFGNGAFSIIEILVGILIFSLGVVSVFSVILSTLNLNDYNKNYIIAANLAREQIELVRNIRDSNYEKIQVYNQINPSLPIYAEENLFSTGIYYKIENNFSLNANFPIKVTKIGDFGEGVSELNEQNGKMNNYRVCLDTENNLYVYCCDTYKVGEKPERCNNGTYKEEKTYFYKYVKIDEVKYSEGGQEKIVFPAFKVNSKVIWYSKGYKEFEITSVFTDFKRF